MYGQLWERTAATAAARSIPATADAADARPLFWMLLQSAWPPKPHRGVEEVNEAAVVPGCGSGRVNRGLPLCAPTSSTSILGTPHSFGRRAMATDIIATLLARSMRENVAGTSPWVAVTGNGAATSPPSLRPHLSSPPDADVSSPAYPTVAAATTSAAATAAAAAAPTAATAAAAGAATAATIATAATASRTPHLPAISTQPRLKSHYLLP